MKNKLSALLCCVLILTGLFTGAVSASAQANTADKIQHLIDGIIAYQEKEAGAQTPKQWLDGELAANAGTSAEWFVLALRQYDTGLDFTAYADALEAYLAENQIKNAVSRQKYALTLIACGRAGNSFVSSTLEDSIGELGIMSWVYGLHLFNNGGQSEKYSGEQIMDKLLSLTLADGGWDLRGQTVNADITAMTIQALAPYYSTHEKVRDAIDLAIERLSQIQLEDGGYQNYGVVNPESAAQVIIALTSLGIDPIDDKRFIKNGCTMLDSMLKFQLADGSFCHAEGGNANPTATAQAFCALISMQRLQSGLGAFYLFDPDRSPPPAESESTSTLSTTEAAAPDTAEPTQTTAPAADTTATQNTAETAAPGKSGAKLWICIAILAAALLVCLILWLRQKRHMKNFVFVFLIAAAALCIVLFTDIQTADSYYSAGSDEKDNITGTVTLTIRCDSVIGKSDSAYIPADGVILPTTEFSIAEGDTVYDILVEAAKKYEIQMETDGTSYIVGLNHLYAFDFGDLSGWVYHVNDTAPSVGCGDYTLSDRDTIAWLYTCDLGNDVK